MRITYDFYQRCAKLPADQLAQATGLIRVLEALAGGPLPLAEASWAVPSGDGVVVCLALACRDLLEIDLTGAPLGPETPVKRRRHP